MNFDIIGLSFGALKERKLRSALTVLMVIIGVALMTTLNGLGGGMDKFIDDQLSMLSPNTLIVTPSEVSIGFGPPQDQSEIKLTSQTVRTLERTRGVKTAFPIIFGVSTLRYGGEEKSVTVMGLDQINIEYLTPKISLETGTRVLPHDLSGIVLGYNLVHSPDMNKPLAKKGQTVSIEIVEVETKGGIDKLVTKKKSFQIRGTLNEMGTIDIDNGVFISLAAANALFNKGGSYDATYVITIDPDENDAVEERIRKIYGKNIGVTSPKAIAESVKDIMGTFGSFISGVAIISMFVGGVGIISTLYTSVMERTREIGLLKAIGYGNVTILTMFLIEASTIGILGGILGLIIGMGGAYILVPLMIAQDPSAEGITMSPYFVTSELVEIFLLALFLSLIAGMYPAWRASKLSPIEALRRD
ncbi:hypothetical protein AC481_02125 [miscellaneous Crenarchaeota group archaeon SMTZ-80]|nr:MAG: hypothetical protein AC481_02125 [miscellaneous Crenarchaeota group archaeon SMTZ-80]